MLGNLLNRREFIVAGIAFASPSLARSQKTGVSTPTTQSLFDGRTLDSWIQVENSATSLSGSGIVDQPSFVHKLASGQDSLSAYLHDHLDDSLKSELTSYSTDSPNAKATLSAMVKNLNQIISGPSIYDKSRFTGIQLRPETQQLLAKNPGGNQLARLNKLLLEDAYPELAKSASTGWIVKDGVMVSTGSGRGVIYTAKDYSHYRLMFTMRHVSGNPDHQACVLIFCTRPAEGDKPLDALGGIQFQVPNGGHWDYRSGMNNAGGPEFTTITKPGFDPHQWSRIELLVNAAKGTARLAVAQPLGSKAVEVLSFNNPSAGKNGPFALQMHNAGLFDEYKDLALETNPTEDDLITVR
jgi:hypothetical protein